MELLEADRPHGLVGFDAQVDQLVDGCLFEFEFEAYLVFESRGECIDLIAQDLALCVLVAVQQFT